MRAGGERWTSDGEGDVDIAAATGYLAARADVDADRIGLLGMSMGGEEAIGASASNDVVRAVVAEGATTRSAADDAWLSEAYGVRGVVQEGIEWAQDRVTSVLTTAPVPTSLRSAVRRSAGTVYLLIAAGSRADEAHAAAYIAGGAPDRVEIWNVRGAGHTRALATAEREWTSRVVAFFEAALRPAPPPA